MSKLLIIIYDNGIEDDVTKVLDQPPITGWTKLFDAHGVGGRGRKANDPAWPGLNNVVLVALPGEHVEEVKERLRAVQSLFTKKPGITIISLSAEVV